MRDDRDTFGDRFPKHVTCHTHTREACVARSGEIGDEVWRGELDEELDEIHERLHELRRSSPWPHTRAVLSRAADAVELARRTYGDEAPS